MGTSFLLVRGSRGLIWGISLFATALIVGLALLPPLLTPEWRPLLMHAFSPVCHQIPVRSPFIDGVQIAVCDRCIGIYAGLVFGVATVGATRRLWASLGGHARYVFLASLIPMGIDWVGPALGLWMNIPTTRAVTGLLFGMVAASFVTNQLISRQARATDAAA